MADIRAMVVFQGATNLPEDRFVNTFHFSNGTSYSTHLSIVHGALEQFWLTPSSGESNAIGSYYSPFVLSTVTIKQYDMSTPEPRVPWESTFTLPSRLGSGLPEECCVVASFHGDPPVTARRRGRVYLGPLTTSAMSAAAGALPTLVETDMIDRIWKACERMAAVSGLDWCVYSPTTDLYVPVTGGFVNNAWDTQRRRGPKETSRDVWPVV